MPKRIVFSNVTPNDQGGIIPNDVIDFSRFNKNPVCLVEHCWNADPIGMWTDIQLEDGNWTGVPVFHGLTEESRTKKALYEGGWIKAASIGGLAEWKTNAAGQYVLDKEGNRICVRFYLYEISIVTLPSNEDAVTLSAKVYDQDEIGSIEQSITTLSSKFLNNPAMPQIKKEDFAKLSAEEKKAKIAELKAVIADVEKDDTEKQEAKEILTVLSSENAVIKFLKDLVGLGGSIQLGAKATVEAPAPKNTPESTQPKKAEVANPQPTPTGLKSKALEKAKADYEAAVEKAEKASDKVKAAKEKAEKDGASAEDTEALETAKNEAAEAMKAAEAAESAYKAAEKKAAEKDDDDNEEEEEAAAKKSAKEQSKNSAAMNKPALKTTEELKTELKLAAAPSHTARVRQIGGGKTFSQLAASKEENDKRLLGRVLTKDAGGKDIAEYAAVLNSILNDGKFAAIKDKTRIMMNVSESQIGAFQSNPQTRAGISLVNLAAQLDRGEVDMMGRDNVLRTVTTLSSTDNALASPALNTIEWLSLAIFKLFPTTSWKNEIPVFGAEMTGKNTGIIWANIAADPTIYKGDQPSNPSNYTYNDTAVALSLTPYWLQPMLWTPLTMHQLRYDQMGTGWAQAFAKWNAVIDDNLIYTLASTVPAGSIIASSGISGYATTPQTFNISGASSPNAFYYNPAFTGNLLSPTLNDVISIEQVYNKQNFELAGEKSTLVVDPTMDALLAKDPETKSLLTRWVNQDGGDFTKFKNTILPQRSRVAIYDPATSQVKDPNGSIPSTAVSAALGFIPSQVGIGLGMLDVFMIQDPTNYGYKMSADMRIGIVPLRADFAGTSLLTYGSPNV